MIENIINNVSYPELFLLTVAYFGVLYLIVGPLFLAVCKFLESKNVLYKIVNKKVSRKQLKFEIKHSLKSILIFGFSSFPIIYLIKDNSIELLPDTAVNIIIGVLILNAWNEVHFFAVHRTMHLPYFLKHVHKIHHKSNVPTVYSVYSFHWFEALLLSTVPITIIPFVSFSPLAIGIYPLTSILINFAGHCNYRFGHGIGYSWLLFGTHHNQHHFNFKQNFGFATPILDKIFGSKKRSKK